MTSDGNFAPLIVVLFGYLNYQARCIVCKRGNASIYTERRADSRE